MFSLLSLPPRRQLEQGWTHSLDFAHIKQALRPGGGNKSSLFCTSNNRDDDDGDNDDEKVRVRELRLPHKEDSAGEFSLNNNKHNAKSRAFTKLKKNRGCALRRQINPAKLKKKKATRIKALPPSVD